MRSLMQPAPLSTFGLDCIQGRVVPCDREAATFGRMQTAEGRWVFALRLDLSDCAVLARPVKRVEELTSLRGWPMDCDAFPLWLLACSSDRRYRYLSLGCLPIFRFGRSWRRIVSTFKSTMVQNTK